MITSLTQVTHIRLIHLRWLSVFGMLVAAFIGPSVLESPEQSPSLLILATFLAGLNACLLLAARYRPLSSGQTRLFPPLTQLGFDLLTWGAYIHLSGGAANPLVSVFLPLVAIGAIVLKKVQAWALTCAAILMYSYLWRAHLPIRLEPDSTHDHAHMQDTSNVHMLGMWWVFVVSAVVLTWFILRMSQAVRERDVALAQAREQAIRNDWLISMGSLAAGAAHALSTPLATLHVLVDDFGDDSAQLTPHMRSDIALMQQQLSACKQALAQLTQRAGYPRSLSEALVPVQPWLKAGVEAWQSMHPSVNIALHLPADMQLGACGFDLLLERALTNLFDNAFNAGALHIRLDVAVQEQTLALTVQDNGCGITQNVLDAFEAGQPIESERGMGIGLLLSRSTIERLGGRLNLQTMGARGTRAHITLPLHTGGATP
jgi:two-component system, sensor histidine kinase RegB